MSVSMQHTAPKIESNDLTLADLLKDFYTVPDFQREYVWQQSDVEKLLDDVLQEFYDEGNRIISDSEYFIGSIVTCPDGAGTYQLIDGQQRLTTIFLVLCAIRDELLQANAVPSETLLGQIRAPSMDPHTGEDRYRYRLTLQYEDSAGILEQIADGQVPASNIKAPTASVANMIAAYEAIREFLTVNFEDNPNLLRPFFATFMNRIKLIRIVTPNLAHALKVFETINDRGVGLNAMDLLKNLLFMRTDARDYSRLKERWKTLTDTIERCREKPLRFLRYYIMSQYEIDPSKGVREDEIYEWFVENSSKTRIDHAPLEFVDRLVELARVYAQFVWAKDPTGESSRYLRNLQAVSGTARQHFILLLAGSHLPKEAFDELVRQIENLFFTFIVNREQTKNLERIFNRGATPMRRVQSMADLKEFVSIYITPELVTRSRSFDFAFRELTTNRIQQYRMRYILAKLAQYVDENAWERQSSLSLDNYLDSSIHVEHILPQRPAPGVREAFDRPEQYDEFVIRLGNLTLLERAINAAVSNGTFEQKRPGYAKSMLLLTKSIAVDPAFGVNTQLNRAVRDLIQFDEWTSGSIELRQEMLADLARRVWMSDVSGRIEEMEV